VRGLQEDVSCLEHDTHTTLPEPSLEQVAGVKCCLTDK
jgi:hypothetical protein